MPRNQQVLLDSRPTGPAGVEHFRLVTVDTPTLQVGQVLVRHHFLSLDPYMRGRMSDAKSYAAPQPLGEVMIGGTVGEIVESRSEHFHVGEFVVGMGGWQEYSVVDATRPGVLRKVPAHASVPLSQYLGAVGMPGVTAWHGLVRICAPKEGSTVVVSAASGAVGSAVAALAKARDCRVVGIAGGAEKCAYATDELHFDACVDYKAHADAQALGRALHAVCPRGVDAYFENVGGKVLDAVLPRMNAFGRIAVCGMIAGYDGADIPMAQPQLILLSRLLIQGFIVSEHPQDWAPALEELSSLVASGRLRPRETVAHGLASAPEAFLGLLRGRNLGKQLVRLV